MGVIESEFFFALRARLIFLLSKRTPLWKSWIVPCPGFCLDVNTEVQLFSLKILITVIVAWVCRGVNWMWVYSCTKGVLEVSSLLHISIVSEAAWRVKSCSVIFNNN